MRWLVLGALLVLVNLTEAVQAQTHVVSRCSRECNPRDADVNGPELRKSGEIVKVILYGHWKDILNMAPLNTQAPDPIREPDHEQGFLMPVIDTNTGTPADLHFKNNRFIMYSSPGPVEYLQEGWRTHQEPGLGFDLPIAGDSLNLYWYMSAHALPNQKSTEGVGSVLPVGVMPNVAVAARMETGRLTGKGLVIAEGDSKEYGTTLMISTPHTRDLVYEFKVPMRVHQEFIPARPESNGFVVTVEPYQFRAGEAAEFAQAEWRVRSGAQFPPRIVLPTVNPIQGRGIEVAQQGGTTYVRAHFLAALGSYDYDIGTARLRVDGPSPILPEAIQLNLIRRSGDCDGHFRPISVTWTIEQNLSAMPGGSYRFVASIENLQGTFVAEQEVTWEIPNFAGSSKVPGFEPAYALAGIAALIGLLQSRRARRAR